MFRLLAALSALVCAALSALPQQDSTRVADDGRAGTVVDRQGLAVVQPTGRSRWTPLGQRAVLLPGDDVRTSIHGANAVEIALAGRGAGTLLIGPGSRVEVGRRSVHLLRGQCEIDPGSGSVAIDGPGGYRRETNERVVIRSEGNATTELDSDPRWLTGYRSSTTAEWMGSLLAQVDGRDVPLSIGYHKVNVVIRDQIAETTIEQSFVNATKDRLEGVFRFPLPADASISGFGMWIGGELIEGDIVEKQRARQIYEDLKRRKEDPGLLEWSGGNLFTARVWPIEPHSEKRIRIRYTQVLPLEGTTFRYRTALRSELLQKHPVRELRVRVDVASARGIAAVSSPFYEVQRTVTEHTATVEFDAEDFRPERDFELAIELDELPPLAVVDHVREGEGWFMVMLQPPTTGDAAAGWQRDLVPEGEALDLVLLCDTSGSMSRDARLTQAAFVEAMLGMLGPDDRFSLAVCDGEVVWLAPARQAPDDDTRAAAVALLANRASLGWSDLDAAFEAAFERARAGSIVIYVGDGIPTTGDADPQELATRLTARAAGAKVTCHAVATASTYEKPVLDAIAAIGGGSRREILDDPASAAQGLLAEVAQPSLKNAAVRFEGVDVARVYPGTLPNVPIGTQQFVLGRFRPGESVTEGRIVVTGDFDGENVSWSRDVALGSGGTGNSFLPRLWARRHVDSLLEQGASEIVQEQIVAFSEEFGILTPYTSLLVLESDAERERYGVTRRVRIRDGEAFFAEGKDRAATETLRTAMREARSWRLLLREQALREIDALGRDLYGWTVAVAEDPRLAIRERAIGMGQAGGGFRARGDTGVPVVTAGAPGVIDLFGAPGRIEAGDELLRAQFSVSADSMLTVDARGYFDGIAESLNDSVSMDFAWGPATPGPAGRRKAAGRPVRAAVPAVPTPWAPRPPAPGELGAWGFPSLPPIDDEEAPERPAPEAWPGAALDALRALDRRPRLVEAGAALEVERTSTTFDEHDGAVLEEARARMIWTPGTWFVRTQAGRAAQPLLGWVADGERHVVAASLGLGRERAAGEKESRDLPIDLGDLTTTDLIGRYREWSVTIEDTADGTMTLVLAAPRPSRRVETLEIDTGRRVAIRHEIREGARVLSTTTWSEFVEVADEWFAKLAIERGPEGGERSRIAQTFASPDDDAFADRLRAAIAEGDGAIVVPAEDPDLEAAREAVHAGSGTFADWFRLCAHAVAIGRHDRARELWQTAATLVEGRRGARWLELRLLASTRRGEERLAELTETAARLAERGGDAAVFLADHVIEDLAAGLGAHERLAVHERLAPCYGEPWADRVWRSRQAGLLLQAGDAHASLALREQLVEDRPADLAAQMALFDARRGVGRTDAAIDGVRYALALQGAFGQEERDALWSRLVDALWDAARLDAAQTAFDAWSEEPAREHLAWLGRWSVLLYRGEVAAADSAAIAMTTTPDLDLLDRPADAARMDAAIRYLLGHGWHWSVPTLREEFVPHLDALCRRLLSAPGGETRAVGLLSGPFGGSDAGRALRAELVAALVHGDAVASLDTWSLLARLAVVRPKELGDAEWSQLAEALTARAAQEPDDPGRTSVWQACIRLADERGDQERALAVLRTWLANDAAVDAHPEAAELLIRRLADGDWSDAHADELLALLPHVADPSATPTTRRETLAGATRFVADALARQRTAHALGPVDALEKLPRDERRDREREAEREMQTHLAARFTAAAATASDELAPWFRIEALCFGVEGAEDRDSLLARTRELLDTAATLPQDRPLPRALRERCSLVLAHAATDRGASADFVSAVLGLYATRAESAASELDWHAQTLRLLAALDQPADMLAAIESWLDPMRLDVRLRVARAKLLAEIGRMEPAIEEMEHVRSIAELPPADLAALADWLLVAGKDERRDEVIDARFEAMTPNELQMVAMAEMSSVSRSGSGVPEDLDPTVLRALHAWLTALQDPTDARWYVQGLYAATKDHRILSAMAHGLSGHAPEQVYRTLRSVRDLIGDVHEEATLDALDAAIADVRKRADSGTDRRALIIAELLASLRATDVTHGGSSHRDSATHALDLLETSVREEGVVPGEAPLLSDLLADLGRLPDETMAGRRLAILTILHERSATGTAAQLDVALSRARAIHAQGGAAAAIDALRDALAARRAATDGALPSDAMRAVDRLVGWWTELGHFKTAESWLVAERDAQPGADEKRPFENRIDQLYANCLVSGGTVSLGSKQMLFDAAKERLLARIADEASWAKPNVVSLFCSLHRSANKAGIGDPLESLRRFAAGRLPTLLDELPTLHSDVTWLVADALDDLGGPVDALRLTVNRCNTEPAWHDRVGQDVWQRFAWRMARWRAKSGVLADVAAPLRELVLDRFERYLVERGGTGEAFWNRHNNYYWDALSEDYVTVARRVLELRAESPAVCRFVADVLHDQLMRPDMAIDAMLVLDAREPLGTQDRLTLTQWLQEEKRWADSLPHAETVANAWPANLEAQLVHVRALGATGRHDAAKAALATAEQRLDEADSLTAESLARLAAAAVEAELDAEAADLYERAIRDRERVRPSGPDHWIATWYGERSRVLAELGRTDEAVDAASAAIVRWGDNQEQRQKAITALENVLASIDDLRGWIARYDSEVAETGLDAPVLRMALGSVLVRQREFQAALEQFRAARDLEPQALESWRQIVAMLDALGRPADASDTLLAAIQVHPRELSLVAELVRRYERIGDDASAERARTDLVEPLPHEPEGHRMLAQLRERAKEFGAAVTQWRQVVRTDRDDAEGWLSLAKAQMSAGDRAAARATVDEILGRDWDSRFGDVKAKAVEILR